MTAKQLLENKELQIKHNKDRSGIAYPDWYCEERMIAFAKLKAQEVLEAVVEKAEVNVLKYHDYEVDKNSILNAYDLNNIQ